MARVCATDSRDPVVLAVRLAQLPAHREVTGAASSAGPWKMIDATWPRILRMSSWLRPTICSHPGVIDPVMIVRFRVVQAHDGHRGHRLAGSRTHRRWPECGPAARVADVLDRLTSPSSVGNCTEVVDDEEGLLLALCGRGDGSAGPPAGASAALCAASFTAALIPASPLGSSTGRGRRR